MGFIQAYFPVHKYNAEHLYDSLRNGLVHLFTIKNSHYSLVHGRPETHLTTDAQGRTLLNAEDLLADLQTATDTYFRHVACDDKLLGRALRGMPETASWHSTQPRLRADSHISRGLTTH